MLLGQQLDDLIDENICLKIEELEKAKYLEIKEIKEKEDFYFYKIKINFLMGHLGTKF